MSGMNRNLSQAPILESKTVAELDALATAYDANDPSTVRIGQLYLCSDDASTPNCIAVFDGNDFKTATTIAVVA